MYVWVCDSPVWAQAQVGRPVCGVCTSRRTGAGWQWGPWWGAESTTSYWAPEASTSPVCWWLYKQRKNIHRVTETSFRSCFLSVPAACVRWSYSVSVAGCCPAGRRTWCYINFRHNSRRRLQEHPSSPHTPPCQQESKKSGIWSLKLPVLTVTRGWTAVTCHSSWDHPASSPVWPPGSHLTHSSRWQSSAVSYPPLLSRWQLCSGSPECLSLTTRKRRREVKGCSCSGHTPECLRGPGSHLRGQWRTFYLHKYTLEGPWGC